MRGSEREERNRENKMNESMKETETSRRRDIERNKTEDGDKE